MQPRGQTAAEPVDWLKVGGEVARDLQRVDFAATSLGPAAGWPKSLRAMVRTLLASRFSMWMAWGPDLTFFCNDAYRRDTLGRKYPWALGRPASEVWSEIWPEIGPRIEAVLQTGGATWDESLLLFLERSGFVEETYHTFSYSPLPDDEGRIAGMLCVVTEETERVVNERRMATLRDIGNVPATGGDARGFLRAAATHLAVNRQSLPFTAAYLFDEDGGADLAATTRLEAHHPVAPERIEPGEETVWPLPALLAGASEIVESLPAGLPSGVSAEPPRRALAVPVAQVGDRRPYGFLAVGINQHRPFDESYQAWVRLIAQRLAAGVAAARSLEIERRRNEQLAELDRAKTAFFSNISHEFRTPLTLMIGPLEDALTAPEGMPPEQVSLVHRNGMRLLKLVGALLDFSRLEAGRMRAEFRPVEIGRLTAELAGTFSDACRRAGLELRIDAEEIDRPVYVDPDLWERIVLNLVSNAFKVTLEGHIDVTVGERDRRLELRVADTGPGIPPDEIDRLFQRFHRVQSLQARSNEGTGIGLALVKELVELHGGEVTVESEVGHGSTFIVRLPLGREHLPEAQVSDEPASGAPTAAALYVEEALSWITDDGGPSGRAGRPPRDASRVLVADDNPDLRRYVVRLLEPMWQVETVSDGRAALERIENDPPDLLITDVMMPGLDGFELLRAVRGNARTRELPVIMLSARAGEEAAIEGLQAGADDYLPKPFSGRELVARVQAHLDLAQVRRQAADELRAKSDRLEEALAQLLRSQQLIAAQRDILALIASGSPLQRTLNEIVRWVELIAEHNARASILLADDGRHLLHGAAPSLPAAYNEAINGIEIGPNAGSCGTSAYLREAVIVEDIETDPRWLDFRDLALEHSLRSCWAVPILATDGRLVGTFALYHDHPLTPDDEDMRLVELLARTAAVAIERNRDHQARARQLTELQSSLLPRELPTVPGLSVAASFRPGDRSLDVGGDFYDVFAVGDGCWGFIVGDVCGHGAEAAAVTALTRHTARAIAPRESNPTAVLAAVSDALLSSGYDRFCTAVFGRLSAVPGEPVEVKFASGGHPAPLLRRADGTVEAFGDHGPLLGVFEEPLFPLVQTTLAPGDTLIVYTDGLIERNPLVPDEDTLRRVLGGLADDDAVPLLATLEQTAIPTVPAGGRDDVAILALRVD